MSNSLAATASRHGAARQGAARVPAARPASAGTASGAASGGASAARHGAVARATAGATARALDATPARSASTSPSRGASRPPRPTLRVVQAPRADRGRTALFVLSGVLLLAGLLTLLLVNTAMAQGSYALHDLQTRSNLLEDREQALGEELATVSAPDHLAARAVSLGLVPSQDPAFLRLPDGRVLGVAEAGKGAAAPTVSTTTTDHAVKAVARTGKAAKATKSAKATTDPARRTARGVARRTSSTSTPLTTTR